jgi:aryl-alcohol dehydrogenase-like predicted oxidoreductase
MLMKRRQFIQTTVSAAAMLGCFPATLSAVERETSTGNIERRSLGRTGEKLSMIGFGGLALKGTTPQEAQRWVRRAYEAGVNYFDVAPSYGDAEERLGPALKPIRQNVFLACKTGERRRAGAAAALDRSLKRLRTDHVDLYQLHAMAKLDEVETVLSDDGALRAFEDAKKAGKIRFIGFSAHSVEAAMALMERYPFDTILFPINYATWTAGHFGPQVLAKAQENAIGILAIKAMAKGRWPAGADRSAYPNCWYQPFSDPDEALLALRFTLSHPVTAAVHPADLKCLRMALSLAPKFTPLKAEEAEALKRQAMKVGLLFKYPQA